MLTKFETKSNRVKGLTFHPKRPWVLCSLHNGIIQLWDYRMGTLLDRFDEHDGPVRGVNFHVSQPLFVSGGDDYKIKVWNYKLRRCMFTLLGHLDYIRTVEFHPSSPWIVSASDDQTIRIWNWMTRTCITVLTGHNHYVMCASFHRKEDLVVSASLDQTVRVWDVAGLRKKSAQQQAMAGGSAGGMGPGMSGQGGGGMRDGPGAQSDLFGSGDAVVKYVLEGHDRGVNWAAFHHTLPLIVSGADDRQVKLWRMNDTKAWEVDTLRGHVNNVSCVLFHPRAELILSNSEDKSIRVWDMSKRTAVATFRREHDRFWVMAAHPEQNLLAAGHDSGMIVFKLERERPATATVGGALYYVKDKSVRCYSYSNSEDAPLVQLRRREVTSAAIRTLSYNAAENCALLCSASEGGTYELYPASTGSSSSSLPQDGYRGQAVAAVFVARNRFCVLDKSGQVLVKDLRNEVTKKFAAPHPGTDMMFQATPGCVILRAEDKISLLDVQQRKELASIVAHGVKYTVWSADYSRVALLSKHAIVVADRNLNHVCTVHETIRIKSGAWDSNGILVYSTLNHIKFCLPNGDNGIVKTLEQPIYVTKVLPNQVYCVDRDATVRVMPIDSAEMLFKLALVQRKYDDVLRMIRSSNLCGQAIIGYLQKKGFPEIALHFVQDDRTRFSLALECGNIESAVESATKLDDEGCWARLGEAALLEGNVEVVEKCYQRGKNFEKLSFLYLITGNTEKLRKMQKIAESRNDLMGRFHNALFLGDVSERVSVLQSAGQDGLAYLTAATHGLAEQAAECAGRMGETPLPAVIPGAVCLQPTPPILGMSNWPQLEVSKGIFGGAMLDQGAAASGGGGGGALDMGEVDLGEDEGGAWGDDDDLDGDGLGGGDCRDDDGSDEGGGWGDDDDDLDLGPPVESSSKGAYYVPPTAGESVADLWGSGSQLAAEHIAAGSFETAMQLMNAQSGIANFEPLKAQFLAIYSATRMAVPTLPSLPPVTVAVYQSHDRSGQASSPATGATHPSLYLTLAGLVDGVKLGYQMFTKGKFADCNAKFTQIVQTLLVLVVDNRQNLAQAKELLGICREYITATRLQAAQKESKGVPMRAAELASYMTHCSLQPGHLLLALRPAMMTMFKIENFRHASSFARRLLELNPKPEVAQKARAVQQRCDANPNNKNQLDYDERNPFVVCASTMKPIYKGTPSESCPFCESAFVPACKGQLCPTCNLAIVGAEASGLNIVLPQ